MAQLKEMYCEGCVFGVQKHATWCFLFTVEQVAALGEPKGLVRVGYDFAMRAYRYQPETGCKIATGEGQWPN